MIKKKSYAMLTIDNGYLYSFFGKGENGNYPDCIERLNLESNNSSWEMILFSNPNNIDTRRYGCGLYHVDELIYFIGGKCNEEVTDEIFFFNLSERRIDKTDTRHTVADREIVSVHTAVFTESRIQRRACLKDNHRNDNKGKKFYGIFFLRKDTC